MGAKQTFAADVHSLASMRQFVVQAARELRAADDATDDMLQAADEAATNIMVHGYRDVPGFLEIEVAREGARLIVYLRDRAPAFDPRSFALPDVTLPLHARRPGGLGIYLMRQFTDEVTYQTLPDGRNELKLARQAFAGPGS